MKYLKLEFYQLHGGPVSDLRVGNSGALQGISHSVTQQSSLGPGSIQARVVPGIGQLHLSQRGASVNWMSPPSVTTADPAGLRTADAAGGYPAGHPLHHRVLPNQGITPSLVGETTASNVQPICLPAEHPDPYILAEDQYSVTSSPRDCRPDLDLDDVPWDEIQAQNPGTVPRWPNVGAIPLRGRDWWVFPGQQLKISASVMTRMTTDMSTVIERKLTLEHRVRFNTTAIHRYAYKTLKRDAAMAYFAGVREVIPFISTFIPDEDKPVFEFTIYDPTQWDRQTRQLESGPVTANGQDLPDLQPFLRHLAD